MTDINTSSFSNETNNVIMKGTIDKQFTYSHELYGEKFYQYIVLITRESGVIDKIPILVSERYMEDPLDLLSKRIMIYGQLRTHNNHDSTSKPKLCIYVFVQDFELFDNDDSEDINKVILDGYVCKDPIYRKTPAGREITDIIFAVNRLYNKSDYIPCICWGRNARFSRKFKIGSRVIFTGRLQSREYVKHFDDHDDNRTAYELSVSNIQELE